MTGLSGHHAGKPPAADRRRAAKPSLAVALLILLLGAGRIAGATESVVRAVLFYFPRCGHCELVMHDVLPGLFEETGGPPALYYDQSLSTGDVAFSLMANGHLQILLVNTAVADGAELYRAATDAFTIPPGGVPRLIVADEYLIGSVEIPERFPGIVLDTLRGGGTIDWPAIPGLPDALQEVPIPDDGQESATQSTVPGEATASGLPGEITSMAGRFGQDPVANSVSLVVLVLMGTALVGAGLRARRGGHATSPGWVVGLLALIGLGIAAYLTFVEVGGSDAVCGPVGDCNTVQQSEFARLFGVIPVGILGVIGYAATLATWGVARVGHGRLADAAAVVLFAGAIGGVLLSCYLTFLEPFVIGASCAWCLGSAVVVTSLMWLTARPAAGAWSRVRPSP
jgi:uncharacterized membrane protein